MRSDKCSKQEYICNHNLVEYHYASPRVVSEPTVAVSIAKTKRKLICRRDGSTIAFECNPSMSTLLIVMSKKFHRVSFDVISDF